MMYVEDVAPVLRAPTVPVALRVLCPPALSVKVRPVTLWNMCKGRGMAAHGIERVGVLRAVGGGGMVGICCFCYVTPLSQTEVSLYQRNGVTEVQPNVDIAKLLKETRKR